MKKYFLIFSNAWQVGWSYRGALLIKALVDITFTIAFILLWAVVYKSTGTLAGFTFADIVTYYILVRVLDLLYTFYPAKYLTVQIKTGNLSNFLTKPINYFNYTVSNTLGLKLARGAVTLVLIFLFFIFFPEYLVFPPSFIYILALIPFGIMSWLIYSELALLIGIASFWISDTGNIRAAFAQIISLLSGGWIPLVFFPPLLITIINFLPIKFLYFYLIQLYQGKIPLNKLPLDFILCLAWVVILWLLCKYLLLKGIKRYEAYGA